MGFLLEKKQKKLRTKKQTKHKTYTSYIRIFSNLENAKKRQLLCLDLFLIVMAGKACNVVCVVKSLRMQVQNHAEKLKKHLSGTHPKISLDIVDFFPFSIACSIFER